MTDYNKKHSIILITKNNYQTFKIGFIMFILNNLYYNYVVVTGGASRGSKDSKISCTCANKVTLQRIKALAALAATYYAYTALTRFRATDRMIPAIVLAIYALSPSTCRVPYHSSSSYPPSPYTNQNQAPTSNVNGGMHEQSEASGTSWGLMGAATVAAAVGAFFGALFTSLPNASRQQQQRSDYVGSKRQSNEGSSEFYRNFPQENRRHQGQPNYNLDPSNVSGYVVTPSDPTGRPLGNDDRNQQSQLGGGRPRILWASLN